MRVITGFAKGHKLFSPAGEAARPTTDRVKEALFSILHGKVQGRRVLDLFAGSGALGIEALSRGASHCDFVDQSREMLEVVRRNLEKTRLMQSAALFRQTAEGFLASCDGQYDLILLDPPYKKQLCKRAMEQIFEKDILSQNGVIVCEAAAGEEVSSPYGLLRTGKYGGTKLLVFGLREEDDH